MTKLEAWKKFCEVVTGLDATDYTLEMSSHGKAFSAGWDFAEAEKDKEIERLREALQLAISSHGRLLLSDPPQDAWKFNRVEEKARAALQEQPL